jgi:hypothetical protein
MVVAFVGMSLMHVALMPVLLGPVPMLAVSALVAMGSMLMAVAFVLVSASATSCAGSNFMPHSGQWPGSSLTTSGCIGQM